MKIIVLLFFIGLTSYSQADISETIKEINNIYQKPDFMSDVLFKIEKHTSFKIIDLKKSDANRPFIYCLIEYNNKRGWLDIENIKNKEVLKSAFNRLATEKYQNECHYDVNEIDEFTNAKKKYTSFYSVADNLEIKLLNHNNSYFIKFKTNLNLECVSPYSHNKSFAKVKLKNNDIITFYHFGDVDCSTFILIGKLSKNEINRLKKSTIETIRLSGTKHYHDFKEISFDNFFIKKLNCLN